LIFKAGEGIEAGWGIEAGEGIKAGSAERRINNTTENLL
jgi:hypothetical protein